MSECIFCRIADGSQPAEVVDADEHTVAFMDIFPATRGHVLVIPRRHVADLWAMPPGLGPPLMATAHRLALRIRDRLTPDGLNLLQSNGEAAFQTVFHLHLHLIPRYQGDGFRRGWDPQPGDPDELAALAAKLRGQPTDH